ncbi:hypothetical protein LIX31_04460 [Leptospira kirschneri]|uniref:LIC_10461 domain-containing protein n=1 Tax=Leptospira kirschneri TaxID=29507 RepID=UPI00027848EE|nr:hypothetical protein [Leptospira kirschneri]EJO71769.1 hypothetical protein LEP1GSC044_1372 [Leptospira kirschneri serovar Grippotyphosa str. RM52]WBF95250.1 hypothetical protein LIX31_04460 [Leptospira kirschneri]
MLSLIKILGFSFTICFFMNCHSTVIVHKENSKPLSSLHAPPPPEKRNKQANTFFGIYSLSDGEEASCQDNPGEVKMVRSIPDTMIHFFAGPFYTSRTVEVYCPLAKDEEKKNEVVKTIPKENQDGKEAVKPNSSPVPDRPKPKDQFEAQEMSENKDTKELKEKPKSKKNNVFDSQF